MWVAAVSSSTILIPLLLGLYTFNSIETNQKYFLNFIGFSFLFEIVSFYYAYNAMDNHGLFKLFILADLTFFIWFYYKSRIFPAWMGLLSIGIFFFSITQTIYGYFSSVNQTDTIFFFLVFVFFILQSTSAIIAIFDNLDLNPANNYIFWIAFARLIYFLIILFIFIYPNLQSSSYSDKQFAAVFIAINATGNILCNVLYGYSFICRRINN